MEPSKGRVPRLGIGAGILPLGLLVLVGPEREARAQGAGSASLRGRVQDASGAALGGATVTLANERTKAVRTQASDARGDYVFVALLPDAYRVRVDLAGFSPWRSGEVHLSPGDSLHLDTTLAVGERSEEVTVAAARQIVRTDSGARDNVITGAQIQNLSIVGRGALELLRILPGVVSDQQSMEAIGFNFGGANDLINYSVNGQRGTQMSPVLEARRSSTSARTAG